MLNIVLINPEIPFNTGNIGRSCVATGTRLHLVGKLGFKIASKEIRRSGLDYWPNLDYRRYETWEEFLQANRPEREQLFFMFRRGILRSAQRFLRKICRPAVHYSHDRSRALFKPFFFRSHHPV